MGGHVRQRVAVVIANRKRSSWAQLLAYSLFDADRGAHVKRRFGTPLRMRVTGNTREDLAIVIT